VKKGPRISHGEIEDKTTQDGKSSAAMELGRKGGKARAQTMSATRRTEIARQAAASRWKSQRSKKRTAEIMRARVGEGGKNRTDYTGLQPRPSKFPRHEPKADVVRAERALFEEMEHAAELTQSREDFGRAGVIHALHSCYSFLYVRGLSGQALKPLVDVMSALESVGKGVLPELFDPKIRPGQVPDREWSRSPAARETKALAAACMDALMNGNLSKGTAASRVADYAVQWPRVSKGTITAHTVANWRDELLQAPSKNAARRYFEGLSRMFSEGPRSKSYLKDALRTGPVLTGGIRKTLKAET
jgi:hypothetical protein